MCSLDLPGAGLWGLPPLAQRALQGTERKKCLVGPHSPATQERRLWKSALRFNKAKGRQFLSFLGVSTSACVDAIDDPASLAARGAAQQGLDST